ncbi:MULTISPECIES: Ig-like domain-containing protein [unclassified Microbacterium]|uniref:Ig-like domain-containing protein n=1 Tax=unclassified Microbacterium TaxID=2609290 RepID=UPI0012FB5D29|nr:Ig-like domain-containing protein [Microbacterium sp. MAH-37]MVQ43865.1 signal peptidase I [Microbacterium sp. MAH-37]
MSGTTLRTAALAVLAIVLIAFSALNGPQFSTAAYSSSSTNAPSTASAAADWTPPTVSVQAPSTALKGAVTLSAVAADGETGVKSVALSVQAAGADTWTPLCTATAAPYSCTWNTSAVPDGGYDVRAVAIDNAGYSATSASVRVTVSNNFGVTLSDPGDVVRGTVALSATLQNAGLGVYTVRIEYAVAGSGNWRSLCLNLLTPPYGCNWNTAGLANGFYDLRAVATQTLTTAISPVLTDVLVDNTAPAVSMLDPGSPLSGTVTITASASDADSGVASVALQYALGGGSAWTTICTATVAPYSCRFKTTGLAGGSYGLRAVATDAAGNTATSAVITRTIDNTISSISLDDPGTYLSGGAALTTSAASTAGITSVTVQYAVSGTSSWSTACTVPQDAIACVWDTSVVPDGIYDLRSVLVDGTGRQTVSVVVTGRRVDNTPVRGLDVQTAGGGAVAGRADAGDTVTLTYSKQMSTGSIATGWNGSALPVTVRLRDGGLLGTGGSGDTIDVLVGSASVGLGSVNLRGDYIKTNKTATFPATMTATTETVGGASVTVVRITLGTVNAGSGTLRTATVAANMTWSPSAAATDLAGTRCSIAPVTETGPLDREF